MCGGYIRLYRGGKRCCQDGTKVRGTADNGNRHWIAVPGSGVTLRS